MRITVACCSLFVKTQIFLSFHFFSSSLVILDSPLFTFSGFPEGFSLPRFLDKCQAIEADSLLSATLCPDTIALTTHWLETFQGATDSWANSPDLLYLVTLRY